MDSTAPFGFRRSSRVAVMECLVIKWIMAWVVWITIYLLDKVRWLLVDKVVCPIMVLKEIIDRDNLFMLYLVLDCCIINVAFLNRPYFVIFHLFLMKIFSVHSIFSVSIN